MTTVFHLPNGVTGICEERKGSGKVAMQVLIRHGGMHEDEKDNGLTSLTQKSCQSGTATLSRDEIARAVEAGGGELASGASRDGTTFASEALSRFAPGTFRIMADVIRNPAFNAADIEKDKAMILQRLVAMAQSPEAQASKNYTATAFAGQSFARDPLGTKESLEGFTRADVLRKHAEMLADPARIIVSFAGDIDAAAAQQLVEDAFGDLPTPARALADPAVTFTGGDSRVEADNEQLNLLLGFPAPPSKDDDRYAIMLLEEALAGGMSSPLFQEIREKRGLVYTVGAEYSGLPTTGIFSIVAGTGKGNAGELVSVTFDLLGAVAREGFDDEALAQARERLMRKMKDGRETAEGASDDNLEQIEEHGRLITPAEVEAHLKAVSNDDIRRVCADFLKSGGYALSAVGPLETLPEPQEIKALMQKALKGVQIPAKAAAAEKLQADFAFATAEEESTAPPRMTILPNGMKIITVERAGNLSCGAWVGAGSDHETPELNGATHMNEHMMFKGTPNYPAGSIDRIVEGELGGGLNAYTTRDRTCYYFYSLMPEALEKTIDICGEMVFKANLDHAEFDGKMETKAGGKTVKNKGERDVVIEELRKANDKVGSRRMDLVMEAAYPGQPHGRTILGPESTLRALTVEQLAAYRDEFYVPNNVIFAAVGPVKHEDFVALVEKKFGAMPAGAFPDLPEPRYHGGTVSAEMKGAKLCNIALAAPAVSRTDADYYAYLAFNTILGEGKSSRLYASIVSEKGLSASINSGIGDFRNAGTLLIFTATAPENIKPVIGAVYDEIRNLAAAVTPEELEKAKTALEMNILASYETNEQACDEYATAAQAFGRLVLPAEISGDIQKLTAEDIRRVAARVLAATPTAATIVPPGTDPKLLPQPAEVLALRDGGFAAAGKTAVSPSKAPPPHKAA